MLAAAVIVFREALEAALVIGLVLAATQGLPGRGRWIGLGIGVGAAFACVLALLADVINGLAEGVGQEIVNASILFTAVAMLGWHNVWMRRHARELKSQLSNIGRAVLAGERPLYVLAAVVGLAVVREGAEVVLFLSGIAAAGSGHAALLAGSVLGLASGIGVGFLLYKGLASIPTRQLFEVSGWLILLLAAGLAAQGAGYLVQADLLPTLGPPLWNTSHVLSEQSLPGQLLHTLVGYVSQPLPIQAVFYVGTAVTIFGLMKAVERGSLRIIGAPVALGAGFLAVLLFLTSA